MKANELRIGNYIELRCLDEGFSHCKELVEWSVEKYNFTHSKDLYYGNDDWEYRPIPLTEEWLLKFGFNVYGSYSFKGAILNSFSLEKQEDFDWEYDRCLKTIKYVHQLQNLYFALTGEELKLRDNE